MPFTFTRNEMSGLILIEQKVFGDTRGFFKEVYQRCIFQEYGIEENFVQDNLSVSARDVLRGLHFQLPPKDQAKLVMVLSGAILDVVVDLRKDSSTYLQWTAMHLSAKEHKSLYIPSGFAHGFLSLENDTVVTYKTSAEYSREHERGIRWNDPRIGIVWPTASPSLSEKDASLPLFDDIDEQPF